MARYWKEPLDPARHVNHWTDVPGGVRVEPQPDALIQKWVYFVVSCSFTFEFHSLYELQICLKFFSEKIDPDSHASLKHCQQRWYERLPLWLSQEPKRKRVVKALQEALDAFNAEQARH
jgi:hypothetical protein